LKVHPSWQGASSSGILPWAADIISQHWVAEKTTGGRGSPVVRNLTLLSMEVSYLNTEALVGASKEAGLKVNPEKTMYMLMPCYQKIRQKHSIKTVNRSFEDVAKFRYLGITLTDQNCMHEEINRRLNLGNACCHSVQSLLSSHLLSRNVKVKIYKTSCFEWV
jgi:hypothetical protein